MIRAPLLHMGEIYRPSIPWRTPAHRCYATARPADHKIKSTPWLALDAAPYVLWVKHTSRPSIPTTYRPSIP